MVGLSEPEPAGRTVRARRLPDAAERFPGDVGPGRQRSAGDRAAVRGQQRGRLRARSDSRRRDRLRLPARRHRGAGDDAREGPSSQGGRRTTGGPRAGRWSAAYSYDAMTAGVVRAAPLGAARARPGPSPTGARRAVPHRRLLRADGDCRRARADDVRGAWRRCAERRRAGALHRQRLGELPDHAAGRATSARAGRSGPYWYSLDAAPADTAGAR